MHLSNGKIYYANKSALDILGINSYDIQNKRFHEIFVDHPDNDDFNQLLVDVYYDKNNFHENIVKYFDGNSLKYLHVKTTWLDDVKYEGVLFTFDDVSELIKLRGETTDLQKLNQRLLSRTQQLMASCNLYRIDAQTDKLTGLLNKAAMEKFCAEYLQALKPNDDAALFVIDLDHFKQANDTFGHQAGDDILKIFADSLSSIFRSIDLLGRFGGDEFVVLLKDVRNLDFVKKKAEQILLAARDIKLDDTPDLHLSASIGVALTTPDCRSYSKLFAVADSALYDVKIQGRNGFLMRNEECGMRNDF